MNRVPRAMPPWQHYAKIMNPMPTAREPWYIIKGGSFDRPLAAWRSVRVEFVSRHGTSKRTSVSAARRHPSRILVDRALVMPMPVEP